MPRSLPEINRTKVDRTNAGYRFALGRNFASAGNFNGTNNFLTASGNGTAQAGSFTITGWFKRSSTTSGSYCVIAKGRANATSTNSNYALYLNSNHNLSVMVSANGSTLNTSSGRSKILDLNWHHVAAVYTAIGSGTSKIDIYLDTFRDGGVSNAPGATLFTDTTSNLTIGGMYTGNNSGLAWPWQGLLDNVEVYPAALSVQQIIDLYNQDVRPVTPTVSYLFNENTGTTTVDSSGNGFTATWQGSLGSQWGAGQGLSVRTSA